MKKREHLFSYEEYEREAELDPSDAELLKKAREATKDAYAPYSRFRVGAAARLSNGKVITGANQENASFPVGICAERVLLSAAAAIYPGVAVDTMAISYHNETGPGDSPISPCGICRQSLQEFEHRTGKPIRLILGGESGIVYIISQSGWLLPFAFDANKL
ncbi:MAG TPA: cytidine deaminase [Puia sp.]|jgi:cytidine deaminase